MANPEFFKEVFDQLSTDGQIGDPSGRLAYCYLRVSSVGQAEEGRSGLPRQILHVHETALANGLRIPWEFVYADDHTGFEFKDRPELTDLRKAYRQTSRQASAIVMENLDRLSRNADWHQGFLLEEMKKYGLEVVFWKSFSSRIERAVIGAISQEGMEESKRRMAEGNLFKAKSGRITARTPAYGFMLVDSQGRPTSDASSEFRKDTHYAPNPEEANVVRLIYEKIGVDGWSTRALSTYLAGKFAPPKSCAFWEPKLIPIIIRNPVYKGEFIAHRYTYVKTQKRGLLPGEPVKFVTRKIERPKEEWIAVPVPPLVPEKLWDMANQMLDKNAQTGRRNGKHPYLLTGLLKCGSCNYSYVGGRKRRRGKPDISYYRCSSRANRARHIVEHIGCTQRQIARDVLEGKVWSTVCNILLNPEVIVKELDRAMKNRGGAAVEKQVQALERRIKENDLEDEKLYRAYLADVFDEREFAVRRRALKESREALVDELHSFQDQLLSVEQLEEKKRLVLAVAEHAQQAGLTVDAPFEFRQRMLKLLVDKIFLDVNGGWFRIEGEIPGRYPLFDDVPIESIPVGRGSSRRLT